MNRMTRPSLLASALVLSAAGVSAAAESAPTFAKDVAPILYSKCISCHRSGEVAPMSLITYKEVRPWAKAIRGKVQAREMPPWGADPKFGTFRNDNSLSQKEIDILSAWAEGGAPKGEDADLPPVPALASGWTAAAIGGGEPDYVIEMMKPFLVPAEGELPNINFYTPIPFKTDRFSRLLEARPGNRSLVHHYTVAVMDLPEGSKLNDLGELIYADGTKQNDQEKKLTADAAAAAAPPARRPTNFKQIVDYVPGRSAIPARTNDIGFRIPAGKYVQFGMHYQPTGRPELDQSKLGIWFNSNTNVQELYRESIGTALPTSSDRTEFYRVEGKTELFDRRKMRGRHEDYWPPVPAMASSYAVVGATAISEPITLYGFTPHMHLRGKDMRWVLTLPDGREETLLNIPKYDFNWQTYYELAEPRKIPAGSTITNVAHYDNTPGNRYNPAPDKEVFWSEQSWDEMFLPYVTYTLDNERPKKAGTSPTQSSGRQQR
jgi:hypothetical protein